jgi:hypothetical protein
MTVYLPEEKIPVLEYPVLIIFIIIIIIIIVVVVVFMGSRK